MKTTARDRAQEFHTQGFLHMESMVEKAMCEKLIARMRDLVARRALIDCSKVFHAGHADHTADEHFLQSSKKISFFFDKNRPDTKTIFGSLNKVGHALHDLCPVYSRFSHQQRFYDLMKTLGTKKPTLVQSMFIFKQPRFGDGVPAHQDATFLNTEPSSVIGLWFALEDACEENGCLWALPGAHQGPLKERFALFNGRLIFKDKKKVHWPADKFIPLRAKAGDVIALHGFLPHYSEPNRSNKTRFAYTLHFIDALRYYPKDNWLNIGR